MAQRARHHFFRLAVGVPIPLQRAARRKHHAHQVPLARNRVAERVQAQLRVYNRRVAERENHARRADRGGHNSRFHNAVADCSRRLIAAPAHDGRADRQTRQALPLPQ